VRDQAALKRGNNKPQSSKRQINAMNNQADLKIGAWIFFGVWDLGFEIFRS
jgi:hypothetical protein